ncbi:MAG: hypothetical protein WCE62_08245 [Polyangiales bacterium]
MLGLRTTVLLLSCFGAFGCGDGGPVGGGGTGGSGGMGGSGGTIEPGPTCIAFCAKVQGECRAFDTTEAACAQGCQANLSEEQAVSQACGEAVEAVFLCATALDCDDVYAWRNAAIRPVPEYPCRDKVEAVGALHELDPDCAS